MSAEGIKRRGFASLSTERKKEIASKGGKRAQALGKSHKFSKTEAKVAGRLGGLNRWSKKHNTPIDPL